MYAPIKIRLAILGSTGSIGQQTLQVVRSLPDRFTVVALAAGRNIDLLAKQVEEFKPQLVYYQTDSVSRQLECDAQFMSMEGMASYPNVDTVVIATSGINGLFATLSAVKEGKTIALANKEPLVMAGHIITDVAEMNDASIVPVDSEHSALFQCMIGEPRAAKYIILTASGGPFRKYSAERLQKVTPQQALRHPSWQMGRKITIDSATLMNKGLEIIEAYWLFGIPIENIRVVIHPQSIIHSMLEFYDGSVKAQMSYPDMRLPIQYALLQPYRIPNPDLPLMDWEKLKELTFEKPDYDRFPCLKLAIDAGKAGGTYPTALCAADDVAVQLFLDKKIAFTDIARLIAETLERHESLMEPGIDNILAAYELTCNYTLELAGKKK
ncbi:MAG TPA: 1-deoxy-D-xylulose-5-phosphate reductoisomerase [Dehalococcoidales bacterium]